MDNNQNYVQPMNDVQHNYGQQMYYNQETYGQQMYYNQETYGQQLYYNQEMYGQPQQYMQSLQMQGYGYQQNQMNYNMTQAPTKIKKPINKKVVVVLCVIVVVAVLAILFLPKLFKSKDPFYEIKPGMSATIFIDKYKLTEYEAVHGLDWEGFGVTGDLSFYESDDKIVNFWWYLYERDCESREQYTAVLEEAKEYYTEKYGTPEDVERQGSAEKLSWETGEKTSIVLSVHGNYFCFQYKKINNY